MPLVSGLLAIPSTFHAEVLRAKADDRAAVAACLKPVRKNAEKQAQAPLDEEASSAGRLSAAAKQTATQPEGYIGVVTIPCQQEAGGSSTAGIVECNTRKWAVWDESTL